MDEFVNWWIRELGFARATRVLLKRGGSRAMQIHRFTNSLIHE
jgi:hypothetical protein